MNTDVSTNNNDDKNNYDKNDQDNTFLEQLSAYLDGELSESESKFLQKRLQHDSQLRATWERWQLASSCLKGHAIRPMPVESCEQIHDALEQPLVKKRVRSPWSLAIAASMIIAMVLFAPNISMEPISRITSFARTTIPANPIATPGSADLIAVLPDSLRVAPLSSGSVTLPAPAQDRIASDVVTRSTTLNQSSVPTSVLESPLPLSEQSPTDFPLVENGVRKHWPQSLALTNSNNQALEAYLVRHNQLMAGDGLSGFLPYVDVVASERDDLVVPNENGGQPREQNEGPRQ